MFEQTIAFIKPEGEQFKKCIIKNFCEIGNITRSSEVVLNQNMLQAVYPHVYGVLWQAILNHLLGVEAFVMKIEGPFVIMAIAQKVGLYADPNIGNDLTTLRIGLNRKSPQQPELLTDGVSFYHRNFIHCARSEHEARSQIRAILNE